MWLPYIRLIFARHTDIYAPKSGKQVKNYDTDSMSIDQVKRVFGLTGFPVKE